MISSDYTSTTTTPITTTTTQAQTTDKATTATEASTATETTTNANANSAAVYEPSSKTEYKPDSSKIKQMLNEMEQKTESMKNLLRGLLEKQATKDSVSKGISKENAYDSLVSGIYNGQDVMVEIDDETRAAAKADIAEGGYYSVEKVTERIMDFAKALTGGDPSKAEDMRKAVQEGFKAAAGAWGGEMPQITQDTYDSIMKEFDDWAAQGANVTTASSK